VPDLERGVDEVETLLGVRASPGGRHQGRGTHNALLALGPHTYLEIIAPDPEQRAITGPLWFDADRVTAPRLVTWAANATELENVVQQARQHGLDVGEVLPGKRTQADGVELRWRYTDPLRQLAEGIVPFFIDWGDTPHPAKSAAQGPSLVGLRAEHTDPVAVGNMLQALSLDLPVTQGERALIATIETTRGRIDLR
jgi:Glyoxalase-like domain